jgi:hypothetical protein
MTSPDRHRPDECPSWSNLARFVAEGGPWPVEHLRTCRRCSDRRAFLENLSVLGADAPAPEPGRAACPEPAALIALVEGDVESAERVPIAQHIAACEACAALLRELVALQDDDGPQWELRDAPAEGPLPVPLQSHASGPGIWSLTRRVAAVLLAAAAVTTLLLVPFPPIDSGSDERWRGPAPRIQGNVEWRAGEAAPTLRWQGWPGAGGYRVRVWDESGSQRFERHVAGSDALQLLLAPARAMEGEAFLWQIDVLASGEVIASSGPVELIWAGR